MACIWVRETLTKKRARFKIEDVCLSSLVSNFKEKLAESSGIDEQFHEVIYRGLVLRDDKTLESYGLKDGASVFITYNEKPNISEDLSIELEMGVEDFMPVLETVVTSPLYKNKMSALLKNPETLENIMAITPGLAQDPVAISILRDPETLQHLVDSGDINKLSKEHPCLIQAASHLAADVTKDNQPRSSVDNHDNIDDDDLMDIDPEMLARAEMMAAHEEQIQNRQQQNSTSGQNNQPITSSFLASALEAARANLVSTSTQTPAVNAASTSSTVSRTPPRPQPISTEYFNQAMATALRSTTSSGQRNWENELRQLRDMGINDEALSLRALVMTGGDVQAACNLIFENNAD